MAAVRRLLKIRFREKKLTQGFFKKLCSLHCIVLVFPDKTVPLEINQTIERSIKEVMKVSGMNPSSNGTEKYIFLSTFFRFFSPTHCIFWQVFMLTPKICAYMQ